MRVVIFDFDGTIADSFQAIVSIIRQLRPVPLLLKKSDIERMRSMALIELTRELELPAWRIPLLLFRGRRMMSKMMPGVRIFPGIDEVIRKLAEDPAHTKLCIVSSNSEHNIRTLLRKYQLEECFEYIHGGSGLFKKAKTIRAIASSFEEGTSMYYVGDEVRDITAAKHAGVKAVSVTWGFNKLSVLKAHQPDLLVSRPKDLWVVLAQEQ